jgi:hypothetical protein
MDGMECTVPLTSLFDSLDEVNQKDILATIIPAHQVINRARKLDSRHEQQTRSPE